MVTIRKLKPLVQIRMPGSPEPRPRQVKPRQVSPKRGRVRVVRRTADHPSPTPQPTPCRLWQGAVDRHGYGRLKVKRAGAWTHQSVHRWVMEAAEGRLLRRDEVVLHACDQPLCFRVDHLSVGTLASNNADMLAKGRAKPPPVNRIIAEANFNTKLTRREVAEIRRRFKEGAFQATLAREFHVSPTAIAKIVKGLSWKHLDVDLVADAAARAKLGTQRTKPVKRDI